MDAKTAKRVWDNLKAAFTDNGVSRKKGLLQKLVSFKLHEFSTAEGYVNRISSTCHDKPCSKHLEILGSTVTVHKPKQLRKKLDAESVRCVFMRYAADPKGYRVFFPEIEDVVIRYCYQRRTMQKAGRWGELELGEAIVINRDDLQTSNPAEVIVEADEYSDAEMDDTIVAHVGDDDSDSENGETSVAIPPQRSPRLV